MEQGPNWSLFLLYTKVVGVGGASRFAFSFPTAFIHTKAASSESDLDDPKQFLRPINYLFVGKYAIDKRRI